MRYIKYLFWAAVALLQCLPTAALVTEFPACASAPRSIRAWTSIVWIPELTS